MTSVLKLFIAAALLMGAVGFLAPDARAGSCCGGGAAAALVLPKNAQFMIDTSLDLEKYNGFWTGDGAYHRDQPGTDMRQYRVNLGYALRLAPRWQMSAAVPYAWNVNKYQNGTSRVDGMGDAALGIWFEALDTKMCRLGWTSLEWSDLIPAAAFGLSLTVPSGVSPYDGVKSDDITGRGFYRIDGTVLLDKTIYPLSLSLFLSYGKHRERPVNREVDYVPPYRKNLGDRATGTLSVSYQTMTDFTKDRSRLTYTAALSRVWEGAGTINGASDPTSRFEKTSIAGTAAWSTLGREWTVRLTWNHAIRADGWGSNTIASDIYSLGVARAFD